MAVVLPFVNASNNPNSEYLSDGLTESLINNLTVGRLFRYHLGMVLLKEGEDVEAKPILSRALTSKLSAADAEQGCTALRQLDAHRM